MSLRPRTRAQRERLESFRWSVTILLILAILLLLIFSNLGPATTVIPPFVLL